MERQTECWRRCYTSLEGFFYKPPLNKRVGDLQWWILKGALAVNVFVFRKFHCEWSIKNFIFGIGYRKNNAKKWQLLNFVVVEAKLSIYKTRKSKIENIPCCDLVSLFVALVKARVWVDFRFHMAMNNLQEFIMMRCYDDVICSVMEDKLVFNIAFV